MLARYIGSKFSRSFQHVLPFRNFSKTPTIKSDNYSNIYRRQVPDNQFEYLIEHQSQRVLFKIPKDANLVELKEKIKSFSSNIQSIHAFSIDLAEYADITKLSDLGDEIFYLILNDTEILRVLSRDPHLPDWSDIEYDEQEEHFRQIGLPYIEQQIIFNYLKRVDVLNAEVLGKKLFAEINLYEGKVNKQLVIKNLLDGIVSDKNCKMYNERLLLRQYSDLKVKLERLNQIKDALEHKAYIRTKLKMSLGLVFMFGHFTVIAVGSYFVCTWDIMEPVDYFIDLMGTVMTSSLYFMLYRDYSHKGILRQFQDREFRNLCRKHEFNTEEIEQIENEMRVLERKIKTNILIDV